MKKYIFILTLFLFSFAHNAFASISLSSTAKAINVVDNQIYIAVDYTATQKQIQALKMPIKVKTSLNSKTIENLSTSITLDPAKGFAGKIVLNDISIDKTKYTAKSTYDITLSDEDSSFSSLFTTPDFFKKVAGAGDWYYTTSYDLGVYNTDINNSFFRFTTEQACKTKWQKDIDDYYTTDALGSTGRRNYSFTECFQSTGSIPSKATFDSKLKPYGTFKSSVPFYYYTWRQSDGSWGGSIGYKTKAECQTYETSQAGKGIVIHCTDFDTPPMRPASWDNGSNDLNPTGSGPEWKEDYTLLAPIGNLTKIDKDTKLGDYLNVILKIAIGLCGALAVIMIVINGIVWMGSDSVFGHTEAKQRIGAAIGGLILALGAYMLLNTINSDLVGGSSINIEPVSIKLQSIQYMPSATYTQITGVKLMSPREYDAAAKSASAKVGIPYCAMRVILQRESNHNPGAIGFDSDVANAGIGARVNFIASKKKYSGTTFSTNANSITNRSIKNDDKNYTNTDDLGLDWRFTHGIGLTQTTCQPKSTNFDNRKQLPNCNFTGTKNYTPRELLDPAKNLEAGAGIWAVGYKTCKKDIFKTWEAYSQGPGVCTGVSTPNAYTIKEATVRTDLYNQCLAGKL